jgi:uncharacterized paraquat-inducible protein A
MTSEILAFWTTGPIEVIVVLVVFFFSCVAPAVGLIALGLFILYRKDKNRKELHRKVQELTEEVARLKQQKE